MAPSFVKKPQLRQEDDGNRLVFECKLAGSPKPEVTWFREDIKIQNDSRTTFKVTEEAKVLETKARRFSKADSWSLSPEKEEEVAAN